MVRQGLHVKVLAYALALFLLSASVHLLSEPAWSVYDALTAKCNCILDEDE